jgi:hypothetical protein
VAQARDYPKSTKTETNRTASTLPHYIVIMTFPRRNAADQSCSNFQRNKQRQRPSYARASAPLANKKHKGETELKTSTGHQSTQRRQQQFANLTPKSAPNRLPLAQSVTNNSNYSKNPQFHRPASVE